MKIDKKEMLDALSIVKPGLANKEMIEQATSFAFIKERVVTFNDEISISHPVKGLELTGAIKAEEFYILLSKMKSDEINVIKKGNEVILKAGKSKAGFVLQEEIKLPIEEVGTIKEWKKIPPKFLEGLQFVSKATTSDYSRPLLTCINIQENGKLIGTDAFRIAYYDTEEDSPISLTNLPAFTVSHILKINPIKIAEGKGWLHFTNEKGTILSCRILEGEFPDVNPFLKIEGTKLPIPSKTLGIIDRVKTFSKRDTILDESIKITYGNNKMLVSSESEYGWIEEHTKIEYDKEPIIFSITPYLLQDILKETQEFIYNGKMLLFSKNNWKYITLIRDL